MARGGAARAQASIEVIMIIGLVLLLATTVIGKWFVIDDETSIIASVRKALVAYGELNDVPRFFVRDIDAVVVRCSNNSEWVMINVTINPTLADTSAISAYVKDEMQKNTGRAKARMDILFNSPAAFFTKVC